MAEPQNMSDLTTEQWQLVAVFVVFTLIPIVAVAMRMSVRRLMRTKLWWDDWLILAALILHVAQLGTQTAAVRYGLGRHLIDIPSTDTGLYLQYTLMYLYVRELFYPICITLVKCSILCLYLRIFHVNLTFRKLCYGMMAMVIAWCFIITFVIIFQCHPIVGAWDLSVPAQCFSVNGLVLGLNIPNVIADAIIILMPMPLVWRLQLSLQRKIGLVIVFCLAAITTIVSILWGVYNTHLDFTDITWSFMKCVILSTVELGVGISCACMPAIYPLLRGLAGRKIRPTTYGQSEMSVASGKSGLRRSHHASHLSGQHDHNVWDGSPELNDQTQWEGHVVASPSINLPQSSYHPLRRNEYELPTDRIMITKALDVAHSEKRVSGG